MGLSTAVRRPKAGHEIAVTSPNQIFFPERGETKLDLVCYYLDTSVAGSLMRAMQNRPVLLQRRPNGAGGPSFCVKRAETNLSASVARVRAAQHSPVQHHQSRGEVGPLHHHLERDSHTVATEHGAGDPFFVDAETSPARVLSRL